MLGVPYKIGAKSSDIRTILFMPTAFQAACEAEFLVLVNETNSSTCPSSDCSQSDSPPQSTQSTPKPTCEDSQESMPACALPRVSEAPPREKRGLIVDTPSAIARMSSRGMSASDIATLLGVEVYDVVAELPKRPRTSVDAAKLLQDLMVDPAEFTCPILHTLMDDPVLAEDGYTYDREAIVSALQHRLRSPTTNADMGPHVCPNRVLRSQISSYKEKTADKLIALGPCLDQPEEADAALTRAEDFVRPNMPETSARQRLVKILQARLKLPMRYRKGRLQELLILLVDSGQVKLALSELFTCRESEDFKQLEDHIIDPLLHECRVLKDEESCESCSESWASQHGGWASLGHVFVSWIMASVGAGDVDVRSRRFSLADKMKLLLLCQNLCIGTNEARPASKIDLIAEALIYVLMRAIMDASGTLPGVHCRQLKLPKPKPRCSQLAGTHLASAADLAHVSIDILRKAVDSQDVILARVKLCEVFLGHSRDLCQSALDSACAMALVELADRLGNDLGAIEMLMRVRALDPTNLLGHQRLLALLRSAFEREESVDVVLLLQLLYEEGESIMLEWLPRFVAHETALRNAPALVLQDLAAQLAAAGQSIAGARALVALAQVQEVAEDWLAAAQSFAAAYSMDSNNEAALRGMTSTSQAIARQCAALQKRCASLEAELDQCRSLQQKVTALESLVVSCKESVSLLTLANEKFSDQAVFAMEWDISSIEVESVHRPQGIYSSEFAISANIFMHLTFYPNGNVDAEPGHCSLFITVHGVAEVDCTLFVDGVEKRFKKPAEHMQFGMHSFCEIQPSYHVIGIRVHRTTVQDRCLGHHTIPIQPPGLHAPNVAVQRGLRAWNPAPRFHNVRGFAEDDGPWMLGPPPGLDFHGPIDPGVFVPAVRGQPVGI